MGVTEMNKSLNSNWGWGNRSCAWKMSKFREQNRRRMISAGTGKYRRPEWPCVLVTICACRWDLLPPPFPSPHCHSLWDSQKTQSCPPGSVLQHSPLKELICSYIFRHLPPVSRRVLNMCPSLSSSPFPRQFLSTGYFLPWISPHLLYTLFKDFFF